MTARTLEEIETPAGPAPRITLEELEGRTTYRTPGPWRVAPTSDYPPGEKPGINIDAGEFGLDGFVCEVCGPNPDERMRADAYFIAHAPDLLAIAQQLRAEIARRPRVGSCVWVGLDADGDTRIWSTGCKQEWIFDAGSPQENGVRFCPHCGAEAEIEAPEDID